MPYVERVTKAGNTIEIERYFTSRYKKKGISRGDKVKPTKEEQEKVNTRQAERKLRILINANYGYLLQQERKITCGKQTLWEQRKAQRLKRGLQQCRKRQQQWKVYKTGKERGVAWAAP